MLLSLWCHKPPSYEENDEVSVVSDSNELLYGGEDEDVAHDDAGAVSVGELCCEVGQAACYQEEGGDDHLWKQNVPADQS